MREIDVEELEAEINLTFCKAYIKYYENRKKCKLSTYIFRALENCTRGFLKKSKRKTNTIQFEENMLKSRKIIKWGRLINSRNVSFRQKRILVLKYYCNLRISDIAKIYKISDRMIKKEIRKGLDILKADNYETFHFRGKNGKKEENYIMGEITVTSIMKSWENKDIWPKIRKIRWIDKDKWLYEIIDEDEVGEDSEVIENEKNRNCRESA